MFQVFQQAKRTYLPTLGLGLYTERGSKNQLFCSKPMLTTNSRPVSVMGLDSSSFKPNDYMSHQRKKSEMTIIQIHRLSTSQGPDSLLFNLIFTQNGRAPILVRYLTGRQSVMQKGDALRAKTDFVRISKLVADSMRPGVRLSAIHFCAATRTQQSSVQARIIVHHTIAGQSVVYSQLAFSIPISKAIFFTFSSMIILYACNLTSFDSLTVQPINPISLRSF